MTEVYLALGSNVDDRVGFMRRAINEIRRSHDIRLAACSSLYQTKPWGFVNQPMFLNAVVKIETELEAELLLKCLKKIELIVGRKPTFRWGPREIDIDIVTFGDLVMINPNLTIPHPEAVKRAFVLKPLLEIAPDLINPETGEPWLNSWKMLSDEERQAVEIMSPPLM